MSAVGPRLGSGPEASQNSAGAPGSPGVAGALAACSGRPSAPQRTGMPVYKACARNDSYGLQQLIRDGVTRDAVLEVDNNGWNGLMVACRRGFLHTVYVLHSCPFLDVNLQDNEGNTALMIASQAGYVSSVMYLLNYYPGVDMEIRDCRGFTALIKAAMKGRSDIVAILLMAGADLHAVDSSKGKCAQEWAQTTGRHDTLWRLERLALRPRAEQCCESYAPEWAELLAGATSDRAGEKLAQRVKRTFGCAVSQELRDDGALDLMVRMTSGVRSPLVATGCRPLCPSSPPQVGKRRLAVRELMRLHTEEVLRSGAVSHSYCSESDEGSCSHSEVLPSLSFSCGESERRGSILSMASSRVTAMLPRGLARRNSVAPAGSIPDINVSRSGEETPKKENQAVNQNGYLEPPTWKYNKRKQAKKKPDEDASKKDKG